MKKISDYFSRIVLGLVIVFSLIVIFSSLEIFGHRSFVVESGSMEPKIKTGSVVFDSKSSAYKIGDVITFRMSGSKDTVTHRVVQIKKDINGNVFYTVKGDANQAPDPNPVPKDNVVGKVRYSVPYMGYVVSLVKSLPGLIVLIIIPATIIVYEEVTNINTEIANIKAAKRKIVAEAKEIEEDLVKEEKKIAARFNTKNSTKKVIIALFLAGSTLIATHRAVTYSYYTDSADVTTSNFTAEGN